MPNTDEIRRRLVMQARLTQLAAPFVPPLENLDLWEGVRRMRNFRVGVSNRDNEITRALNKIMGVPDDVPIPDFSMGFADWDLMSEDDSRTEAHIVLTFVAHTPGQQESALGTELTSDSLARAFHDESEGELPPRFSIWFVHHAPSETSEGDPHFFVIGGENDAQETEEPSCESGADTIIFMRFGDEESEREDGPVATLRRIFYPDDGSGAGDEPIAGTSNVISLELERERRRKEEDS